MAIEWFDVYSIDIKEIDLQHKHFIGILDNLYQTIKKGEAKELDRILKDLSDYAEMHFATEERYFDQFNYENAEEHKKEHRKLAADVEKFLKRKDKNKVIICNELLEFLEEWLHDHMANQDQKFTQCFKKHGLK
jgi:hemerythrin